MPIKGVIFDLGNTLMYFAGNWPEISVLADEAMVKNLVQAGYDLDQGRFAEDFRSQLNEYYLKREQHYLELTTAFILKKLLADYGYPTVADSVVEQALESLYQVSQSYWLPEQDTLPTMAVLKEQGYRLGVISNAGDDADVQNLIDKAQVRPFMDFILSSAACGIRKPNPEIFQIALSQWEFSPQEVAMVGDTLDADILGGNNSGFFTVWITRRANTHANQIHQENIHPDATIQTLAELPGLLANCP